MMGGTSLCPAKLSRAVPLERWGTVLLSHAKMRPAFYCQSCGAAISSQALEEEMKPNQCACEEPLMTGDEMKRAACWSCAGFSLRLALMDSELAVLEAEREAIHARPLLLRAS